MSKIYTATFITEVTITLPDKYVTGDKQEEFDEAFGRASVYFEDRLIGRTVYNGCELSGAPRLDELREGE